MKFFVQFKHFDLFNKFGIFSCNARINIILITSRFNSQCLKIHQKCLISLDILKAFSPTVIFENLPKMQTRIAIPCAINEIMNKTNMATLIEL